MYVFLIVFIYFVHVVGVRVGRKSHGMMGELVRGKVTFFSTMLVLGVEIRALVLAVRVVYSLSHLTSPIGYLVLSYETGSPLA
jgi:phosphatidylglycerophosphate synthase